MLRRPLAAALLAATLAAGCAGGPRPRLGERVTDATSTTSTSPPTTAAALAPDTSFVAHAKGPSVAVHDQPGSPAPRLTLPNPNENLAPLVFLVRERRPDWLQVDLPVRPNGSTGWIRARDVDVRSNTYRVIVELGAHRIRVTKETKTVFDEPVGVGTNDTPTPGGVFYIKELLQPPDPGGPYGPFAYGLSGFSNVLTSFGGGPGVIGIHGTNDPSSIGRDVSHGCIRLNNEAIVRLKDLLPLGTPVEIRP